MEGRSTVLYSHFPGGKLLFSHLSGGGGGMAMVKRHYITPQPLTMQVNHDYGLTPDPRGVNYTI